MEHQDKLRREDESKKFWESRFERLDPSAYDFAKSIPDANVINFFEGYSKENLVVLDLGCGTGRNAQYINSFKHDTYGVDISDIAIKFCKASFNKFGLRGVFKQGTFDQIPFGDDFFDVIICTHALDHITLSQTKKSIVEMRRVLKKDGVMFISFDPEDTDEDRLEEADVGEDGTLFFTSGEQKGMIFRRYSDEEIRSLFGEKLVSLDYCKQKSRLVITR